MVNSLCLIYKDDQWFYSDFRYHEGHFRRPGRYNQDHKNLPYVFWGNFFLWIKFLHLLFRKNASNDCFKEDWNLQGQRHLSFHPYIAPLSVWSINSSTKDQFFVNLKNDSLNICCQRKIIIWAILISFL